MSPPKRGLGRGLSALIPSAAEPQTDKHAEPTYLRGRSRPDHTESVSTAA